jgi:hypothetical protein
MTLNKSTIEDAALAWFAGLDYATAHGLNFRLAPSVESATSGPDQVIEVGT